MFLPNFLPRQARLECPAAPPGYRADLYGTFYCVGGYGHNWSSAIPAGSGSARLFEFRFNWLNPKNSGTRAHGLQLRCLQEHPEGVLLGFSQPNLNRACRARKPEPGGRESSALRPPPEALRAWALRPRDAEHHDWFSPKLGRDLPMTGRSFAPRRPAVSRLRSSGPRKPRPEKRLGPTVSGRAPFSAMPPRRGGRAGRLPLGRNAQRLLLPASTPNAHSRASGPRK